MDTHTLYSAELNALALLYSAELSRTECLSMSIPINSLQDWQELIFLTLWHDNYLCKAFIADGASIWFVTGVGPKMDVE